MILPSNKLRPENSLINIGGKVLALLDEPKTVSRVWEEFKRQRSDDPTSAASDIAYDWFVLALDLLFTMDALGLSQGRLYRRQP